MVFEVARIPGVIFWESDVENGTISVYLLWIQVTVPRHGYGRELVYEFAKYVDAKFGRCRIYLNTVIGPEYYAVLGFHLHDARDNEMSGLCQTIMRTSAQTIASTRKLAAPI